MKGFFDLFSDFVELLFWVKYSIWVSHNSWRENKIVQNLGYIPWQINLHHETHVAHQTLPHYHMILGLKAILMAVIPLETNLDVSALLLSSLIRWYIIQVCFCHVKLRLAGSIFLHPWHQNSRYEQKKIWIQAVENDPTIFDNLEFQKNIKSPIWRFNDGWRHEVV